MRHESPYGSAVSDQSLAAQLKSFSENRHALNLIMYNQAMVVSIKEAQRNLEKLFKEAAAGQEVLIRDDTGVTVKIVPEVPKPISRGLIGSAKGLIQMSDDFTVPLSDLEAAIYGDSVNR
jgi:antitoxin (DNA-binding transcriptional repressor) of toxin-antitoxin stability system